MILPLISAASSWPGQARRRYRAPEYPGAHRSTLGPRSRPLPEPRVDRSQTSFEALRTIFLVDMMRLRHDRSRGTMAGLALALYLAGTNYCLVGGIASGFGASIPCMAPAKAVAGSCHGAATESHCAQAAANGASGASREGSAPLRTQPLPCCLALAPVLATPGVEIPASAITLALPASPESDDAAPVLVSWHGYRVTRDAGPPAPHSPAPQSPRAPPLA